MQRQTPFLIKLYSHCVQWGCPSMTQHTNNLQMGVIWCSQGKGRFYRCITDSFYCSKWNGVFNPIPGIAWHSQVCSWAMCILGYPGKSPSAPCKSSVTACLLNLCLQLKGKKILLISEYIRWCCHLQHLSAHYRSSRYFDSKVVLYPSFASFLASYL